MFRKVNIYFNAGLPRILNNANKHGCLKRKILTIENKLGRLRGNSQEYWKNKECKHRNARKNIKHFEK